MCGGTGSRLWPSSTPRNPKQFQHLIANESLLEMTIARINKPTDAISFAPYVLIASIDHKPIIQKLQSEGILSGHVIYEPCVRSTAPTVAIATKFVAEKFPSSSILILPSDALIADNTAFERAVTDGLEFSSTGNLVAFGAVPDRPHTGFGYIHRGEKCGKAFKVSSFIEKPDHDRAKKFLEHGGYYWNAGIFLFRPDAMAREFEKQAQTTWTLAEKAYESAECDGEEIVLAPEPFAQCEKVSIDEAVMENANSIVMVPTDMGWSDIGSWDQVYNASLVDKDQNAVLGDVVISESTGNLVRAEQGTVVLIGVKDTIVVTTQEATLVAHRDHAQGVKEIVEVLQRKNQNKS